MTLPARGALHEVHARLGATFGSSRGSMQPQHYGDSAAETAALRDSAVIADDSPRSRLLVTGSDAHELVSAILGSRAGGLEENGLARACSLSSAGDITDLVLAARTAAVAWLLSGEPGRGEATLLALRLQARPPLDVRVEDRTSTTCTVTVAGPAAASIVQQVVAEGLPARVQPGRSMAFEFHGFRALVVRAGEAGEDAFSFTVAPAVAAHLYELLVPAGARPMGALARDVARVEACVPAFEPDLAPGLSPSEADLDVALGVPPGRDGRILSALLVDGTPVPPGTPVLRSGDVAGEIRSCVFSVALDSTLALAILGSRDAVPGVRFEADGRQAAVVRKPFVRRRAPE